MALKDILSNGKYADDMILSLPDGTTATVGEMRAMEAEERGALIQRSQIIEKAEMELAARINAAQSRGLLNTEAVAARSDATVRRAAAEEFGLDESDPLLGQVVKELRRIETEGTKKFTEFQTKTEDRLKQLAAVTASATGAYLQDYYATRYDAATASLPADIRKTVSLEDAVKYATDHRMMDKVGRLDVDQAVDRLTWNALKEHERTEVKTQANKDAERQADLARMSRPSPSALRTEKRDGFSPVDDKGRTKSFDEVLAEAATDSSLWDSIAKSASGFGPN